MATVPNISFSGFFDGYSDRDRQIAEERKREQERITWMNAESERERKRLEADEALRYWGLDDAVRAREERARLAAQVGLADTQAGRVALENIDPTLLGQTKGQELMSRNRRTAAEILPRDAGSAAMGVAPSRFDPYSRELETARAGLGGTPTVSALQALLGQDAATRTEAGISLPGGANITDSQAATLLMSGIAGITADEINNEKAAMAILEKSVNPASTKADPRIDILQKSITGWQKRLEDTRDPAEKDRLNGLIRRADSELLTMLPLPPESTTAAPPAPARIDVSPLAPVAAQPTAQVVRAAPVAQPAAVAAPVAAPIQSQSTSSLGVSQSLAQSAIKQNVSNQLAQARVELATAPDNKKAEIAARIRNLRVQLSQLP